MIIRILWQDNVNGLVNIKNRETHVKLTNKCL